MATQAEPSRHEEKRKKKEIYMEVFQFFKTLIPYCKPTDRHSSHLAEIYIIPN